MPVNKFPKYTQRTVRAEVSKRERCVASAIRPLRHDSGQASIPQDERRKQLGIVGLCVWTQAE
jgi:hypothetical protein